MVPQPCFPSEALAAQHRPVAGWFSFVQADEDGYYCVKEYGVFHWLFAVLLVIMAVLAAATAVFVALIFMRRRLKRCFSRGSEAAARDIKQAAARSGNDADPATSITAVVPCYLPNEQDIIEETISWIMHKVESPGKLEVLVVYNTPRDLPAIEARLQELAAREDWPNQRRLRVLRCLESKSKAANLNAALKLVEDPYVVIYDADHHPDSQSLLLLFEKMIRKGQDCVQGSYYMRNLSDNQFGCSPCAFPCLARIIDAEFFTDWFFMKLVTRTFFLGSAYFSGSNALWKTASLAARDFSVTAQTEDVDMAIQQLLDGRKIEFCAESRSGELAPMSCAAMWKQRLRWTIGWDETSLKHGGAFTDSGRLSCRARFGLIWTFLVRWVMTVLTVGAVYVGFPVTMRWSLTSAHWGRLIDYAGVICFVAGAVPWLCATLEAVIRIPDRGWQGLIQVFFVFIVASPFGFAAFFVLSFLLQVTSCWKISTGSVGGWEVTARGPAKPSAGTPEAAKAGDLEVGIGGSDAASTAPSDTESAGSASCSVSDEPADPLDRRLGAAEGASVCSI
jgi:cellulose synthase/poly-beta-1,6-N-acetylglucosamine synthase-like glycosyltransferase